MDSSALVSEHSDESLRFLQTWAYQYRHETAKRSGNNTESASSQNGPSKFADYVISFKYSTNEISASASHNSTSHMGRKMPAVEDTRVTASRDISNNLADIIKRLARAGLDVEVREGLSARERQLRVLGKGASSSQNSQGSKSAAVYEAVPGHVLLFVNCSGERLIQEWRRTRLHDWLCGMVPLRRVPRPSPLDQQQQQPQQQQQSYQLHDPLEVDSEALEDPTKLLEVNSYTLEDMSTSERQRLIYKIIVGAVDQGGAAVNPDTEKWVESIFPLQDRNFNKSWLKHWSSKWLIDRHDLRSIREHFGEEIAMYFAFLQSYFLWLAIPSAIGVSLWLFGKSFSWAFAIILVLWGVLFTETWARRESDIATYWGAYGATKAISSRRPLFKPDRYVTDTVTGEPVPYFSNGKRWARRLFSVPVILVLALLMALFVTFIFAVLTFLEEYYDGPFHSLLSLTPTILFSACLPIYTALCTHIAKLLTDYENYEYENEYASQYTVKIFIFQFLQDQLYLFLTAWVFVPNRDRFESWLRIVYTMLNSLPTWLMPLLAREEAGEPVVSAGSPEKIVGLKSSSTPAAEKVQVMLMSFVVTNQVINLVLETGIPLVMRWWNTRNLRSAAKASAASPTVNSDTSVQIIAASTEKGAGSAPHSLADTGRSASSSQTTLNEWIDNLTTSGEAENNNSNAEIVVVKSIEQQFVARITSESHLPEYNIYEDYAEMASQFGRVSFFSVAWPLAPLAAFLNNWVELRSDAVKICATTKKPISRRVDSIGPWLTTLRFMCWLSSITNSLLIYQFHPNCAFLPNVTDLEEMKRFGRTNLSFALIVLLFSEHIFLSIRWVITQIMASWPGAYERITARAHELTKRRWLVKTPTVVHELVEDLDEFGVEKEHPATAEADDQAPAISSAQPTSSRSTVLWRSELTRAKNIVASSFKTE